MSLAVILAFFGTYIKAALDILSSVLSIVASTFKSVTPLLEGATQLVVWFAKEFYNGLKAILSNLSTLAVISVVVFVTGAWVRHKEQRDCRDEVQLQKQIDEANFGKYLNKLRTEGKLIDQPRKPARKPTHPAPASWRYQW